MKKIKEAIDEDLLEQLILTATQRDDSKIKFFGRIKSANKDFVFIEITNKKFAKQLNEMIKQRARFKLEFSLNRVSFQAQHLALEYFERHKLFGSFIDPNGDETYTDMSKLSMFCEIILR